jgi:hypothetical protein
VGAHLQEANLPDNFNGGITEPSAWRQPPSAFPEDALFRNPLLINWNSLRFRSDHTFRGLNLLICSSGPVHSRPPSGTSRQSTDHQVGRNQEPYFSRPPTHSHYTDRVRAPEERWQLTEWTLMVPTTDGTRLLLQWRTLLVPYTTAPPAR